MIKQTIILRVRDIMPKVIWEQITKQLGVKVQHIILNIKIFSDVIKKHQHMVKIYNPHKEGNAGKNTTRILSRKP